ncbi:hypothetical protein [Virgisporangium aliadipatigenens]|nr:hypothetical protein [Virgisporangium aliadipatigenens]
MSQPRRSVIPEVLTAVAATVGAVGLIAGVCFVLYRWGPDLDWDEIKHFWTWDPGLWVTLIFKLKILKVILVLVGVVGFMAVRISAKLRERRERDTTLSAPPVFGPPDPSTLSTVDAPSAAPAAPVVDPTVPATVLDGDRPAALPRGVPGLRVEGASVVSPELPFISPAAAAWPAPDASPQRDR